MEDDKRNEIKQAIVSLLSRREYSRVEIERKYKGRYEESQVNEVLEQLIEDGWQSDKRYAEMLVRHTVAKGQGPLKLMQKSKEKGVSEDLIKKAVEDELVDWYQVAGDAYTRKYRDLPEKKDRKQQDKRTRFMLSRGFSFDQVKYAQNFARELFCDESQ